MATNQGSTLYGGSVSNAVIYEILSGEGFTWKNHLRTELMVDGKPRQLTRSSHAGNPIAANVRNPRRPADFPAGTTVDIDGRQLSVVELMVADTIDAGSWKSTFPRFQPKGKNLDLSANPEILSAVLEQIKNATHTQLNLLHSVGDVGSLSPELVFYDGFVTKILADVDATQVGAVAVIDSSNAVSQVYALRNAVPPRLRNRKDLKIFCSYADWDIIDQAVRLTQTQSTVFKESGTLYVNASNGKQIPIIAIEGIPKDFMFITIAGKQADSNLVQGFWVADEENVLKVYREQEADQDWNILMRFDTGVEYYTGLDIFYTNNV